MSEQRIDPFQSIVKRPTSDGAQDVALICYRHGWMDDYTVVLGRCPFCELEADTRVKSGVDRFIAHVNAR
jgi:hypothetical protein